ncbi:MAG: hypothetical protein KGH81_06355 [Thaumarchaeota archaeon]|nr:hypothetical protein [Nitrososphaerota archaeon]
MHNLRLQGPQACRVHYAQVKEMFMLQRDGLEIPKDKLDKIFVRFYQVDTSNTREHKGTGLGLSICKGIVEGMVERSGRIKGMGQGTEIHILLPA